MDYKDAWMLLKERVKADASTPPACVMWVQGVIATVEQDLAVMEPPLDITAGGALALAGGNALGLMRMEERVKVLEEWYKRHIDLHADIEHGLDGFTAVDEKLHIEIGTTAQDIRKQFVPRCDALNAITAETLRRVEVLEGSYVQHNGKLLDHDEYFKRMAHDMKRLIGIIEAHVKKGFWG